MAEQQVLAQLQEEVAAVVRATLVPAWPVAQTQVVVVAVVLRRAVPVSVAQAW